MIDMSIALGLHVLAAVIWVGGMAFAYGFVRPAAGALEGPSRQVLWRGIFARFFPVVWACVIVLLASGYYMLFAGYGGFGGAGVHIHLMQALGILMMLIFAHVYTAPWQRFRHAVANADRQAGARNIEQIRGFIAINLGIGLVVVAIASSGRYWA
jgi:uncharacterized membrane protein